MQFPEGNCITRVVWCVYIPEATKETRVMQFPEGIASRLLSDVYVCRIKETRVMQFPKGNCIMLVVWCVCMYVEGNIKITRVMQFPRGTCITLVVWCVCMPKAIKKHEWGSMARRFGASWLFLEDFMRFHDFDGQRFSSLEQRFLRGKISAAKTATGCKT